MENVEANKIAIKGAKEEVIETPSLCHSPKDLKWIDREESWLQFNDRVLNQYKRGDIPLDDRLQFISIADSNLSEFISVRFAEVLETKRSGYVKNIRNLIRDQKTKINEAFNEVNSQHKLISDIPTEKKNKRLDKIFNKTIYPMLTPITVGNNKEVPILSERDINFFIKLSIGENNEKVFCFIQLPHQLKRFFEIKEDTTYIYLLEDIVVSYMNEIFNTCKVDNFVQFTVFKNYAEQVTNDDDISIVTRIEDVLERRRENNILFMDVIEYKNSGKLIDKLRKLLKVRRENINIFTKKDDYVNILGLHCMNSYPRKLDSTITFGEFHSKFKPVQPEELIGENSILGFLKDEDLVVHHPYEKYDIVVDFLREASVDPGVVAIKQTLYRVSSHKSPIIDALCVAARNGIKVTVMLELLARFDERQNVSLIDKLKKSGVNIVYSLEGLKTHCKMCLVVKATKKGTIIYSHVGTGNYNERSAKIYTDISYFTSKLRVGAELNQVFNMITGFSKPNDLKQISYSPATLRPRIIAEMKRVCTEPLNNSQDGNIKRIIYIKINSLSDEVMVGEINKLAKAHPNVEFKIICRGICSLPARENVHIKSIVGRFLEHSRIYMFQVGKDVRTYISSADLLTRNLDKRIETLIEVTDASSKKKIKKIFSKLWIDTANTSWLGQDGIWRTNSEKDFTNQKMEYINSQNSFITTKHSLN